MASEPGQLVISIGYRAHEPHSWQLALREDALGMGCSVLVAKPMPDYGTYGPNLRDSVESLRNTIKHPERTVLVSHSLGVAIGLSYAERLAEENKSLKGFVAVAGFTKHETDFHYLSFYYGNYLLSEFLSEKRDWGRILKASGGNVAVFHSDDDPVVNPQQSAWLADRLGTRPIALRGMRHCDREANVQRIEEIHHVAGSMLGIMRKEELEKPRMKMAVKTV